MLAVDGAQPVGVQAAPQPIIGGYELLMRVVETLGELMISREPRREPPRDRAHLLD